MSRYYNINGKEYVSVTTVLNIIAKPYLVNWLVKLGKEESDKISKEATDIGKQVHEALGYIVKGKTIPKHLRNSITLQAQKDFKKWQRKTGYKSHGTEVVVHSEFYNYAGTLDDWGTIDDEIVIIDWKTSKQVNKEHYLQICAYQNAYWEMYGKVATQMYIFRFSKTEKGKGEIIKITNADSIRYFDLFVEALDLWNYMNTDDLQPNNIDEAKYLWEQREGIHYARKRGIAE